MKWPTILLLPLFCQLGVAHGNEPKSREIIRFEEGWLKKHADQFCGAVTGVLLTTSIEISGADVCIRWTIKFDGERSPLCILRPMPPNDHFHSTQVVVIVPHPERPRLFSLTPIPTPRRGEKLARPKRDDFLVIPKGTSASGEISFPLRLLKERLLAENAAHADRLPQELYIGMDHSPWARGAEFGLDAWTEGSRRLASVPQRVVNKWP